MNKNITILAVLFFLLTILTGRIEAKQPMIDICHVTEGWVVSILTVPTNSLVDHFDHGDFYAMLFYRDADNDGYGDPNSELLACFKPEGYVEDATDCDDTDPNIDFITGSECGDGIICAELGWAVYMNGLYWAYASPCSGGCSNILPLPDGWRLPSEEEFEGRPQTTAEFNDQCAAHIFDPIYDTCNFYDYERGFVVGPTYPNGSNWETVVVHDLGCPGVP